MGYHTGEQLRAARAMLGWEQSELAYDLGVSQIDISLFEAGKKQRAIGERAALQRVLEQAGIEFVAQHGGGAAVRLREPK